jgi:uncharacterized membrane protein YraQ (UPF0718 family)
MTDHTSGEGRGWKFDNSRIFKYLTDRVVVAIAVLFAAAALVDMTAPAPLALFTLEALWETAPFIAVSVMLAGAIKASGADATIAKALSGRTAILTAAIFGAISPFCSCGVVPLIAALLAAGVPLAPVMAFWLASPVMDPEMFVLTWGVLGIEMAVAKTVAAVGLGLLGGATVYALRGLGGLADPLRAEVTSGCGTSACGPKKQDKPVWRFWREAPRRGVFLKETQSMGWFLGKWLTLAFLLEGMMVRWVPIESIAGKLAALDVWSVPAAALVGVPAYLNGYAAIPLVRGLMEVGVDPGAALAFMVAGGVTSIPAAIAVKALVKTPVFLLYLVLALTGSTVAGIAFGMVAGSF